MIFRQVLAIGVLFSLIATSAVAQRCSPPAGMGIRQWYSICGPALQQAYQQGMGQGLPYDSFVQSMYQIYAQPVRSAPGGMTCAVGQTQCFNGYLRRCQTMPTGGTWWVTGTQQCR
jgi:hypothetical protein